MSSSKTSMSLSTTKTKHIKVKHPKRKLYRSSDPLLSVFMWGINHTVRELTHISIPVMLMPDDFRAFTKIKIDNHAFNKENLPSHFKVSSMIHRIGQNISSTCLLVIGQGILSFGISQFTWTFWYRWFGLFKVFDQTTQAFGFTGTIRSQVLGFLWPALCAKNVDFWRSWADAFTAQALPSVRCWTSRLVFLLKISHFNLTFFFLL